MKANEAGDRRFRLASLRPKSSIPRIMMNRPSGQAVRLVVVHAISLPPDQFGGQGVEQLFTNTLNPAEHP